MDFIPVGKTIQDLLISGHQFEIPRFQRAYSWEQRHYAEFLKDIVANLTIQDGKVVTEPYFLGTMLFVGNFVDSGSGIIKVVDGQQRLTTITILFSVLSDIFKTKGEDILASRVFKYIMTEDNNGEEVRILKTKSNYPYFAYFIQDYSKTKYFKPTSEEEENIKATYDYLYKELDEKRIKQTLKKNHGTVVIDNLTYIDILKAIRDQVLKCSFISISTDSNSQANQIFEILNAKGKRLDEVDLIKNKIFEIVKKEEPVDVAYDYWTRIRSNIEDVESGVGMATFYRHFWAAKYKRSVGGKLYEDFKSLIVPKNEDRYTSFLDEMLTFSEYYAQIINPDPNNYNNRQEYLWLVQSLTTLNDTFNIVQVRVPLLALMYAKKNDLVSMQYFKKAINYLENFHFAFNVIVSDRANKLDPIYSSFAVQLCKAQSKSDANRIIDDELIAKLDPLFPSFALFSDVFSTLQYSKEYLPTNVKVKYAMYKLHTYYTHDEIFTRGLTIEHIVPEMGELRNCSIGNLFLLETNLNNEAGNLPYESKKSIYVRSKNARVTDFVNQHQNWDASQFEERAKDIAKEYYTHIFNKTIEN